MTLHLPSETAIADWITTLGVTSLCQWDVLVFLSRHQATLLGTESLARLLGYALEPLVAALETLEALTLVERSRVSQGARLYHCLLPCGAPRGVAFAQLQALASHRAGRIHMATQLRRKDHPLGQTPPVAPHARILAAAGRPCGPTAGSRLRDRRHPWLMAS
jgi:hypothetical protein